MRKSTAIAVLVALVVAAGCGGDDSAPRATTGVDQMTTVEPLPPPPPPKPKPRTIVIVVDQGRPRGGIKRPKIEKGEMVVLVIRSDAGEAVHVHGYDAERPLRPGTPLRIPITATIPGRFEVELHHPDVLLAVLEVRP